jgi:hypothetical protein
MRTPISRVVWPEAATVPFRRGLAARAREDSPYSPYLRSWIAHWAAQHRDLLRTIEAAERIGSRNPARDL